MSIYQKVLKMFREECSKEEQASCMYDNKGAFYVIEIAKQKHPEWRKELNNIKDSNVADSMFSSVSEIALNASAEINGWW